MMKVLVARVAKESGRRPSDLMDTENDLSECERFVMDIDYYGALTDMQLIGNEVQRILVDQERHGSKDSDFRRIQRMSPDEYQAMRDKMVSEVDWRGA